MTSRPWPYRDWAELVTRDLDRWMIDEMTDDERDAFEQLCSQHVGLVLTGFWFAAKRAGMIPERSEEPSP
jgi:hypothetical protein